MKIEAYIDFRFFIVIIGYRQRAIHNHRKSYQNTVYAELGP
jgi:hypothetical protein